MKLFSNTSIIYLVILNFMISAEPENNHIDINKLKLNYYFDKEILRILIVPEVGSFRGEYVLRGAGTGYIYGDKIREIEKQLSDIRLNIVEPFGASEKYQIYVFYKNNKFEDDKQILTCQISNGNINIMVEDGANIMYLKIPENISILLTSSIITKQHGE